MLIDALSPNLTVLFGEELSHWLRSEIVRGRDPEFAVSPALAEQWRYEQSLKDRNAIPTPRREWHFAQLDGGRKLPIVSRVERDA